MSSEIKIKKHENNTNTPVLGNQLSQNQNMQLVQEEVEEIDSFCSTQRLAMLCVGAGHYNIFAPTYYHINDRVITCLVISHDQHGHLASAFRRVQERIT